MQGSLSDTATSSKNMAYILWNVELQYGGYTEKFYLAYRMTVIINGPLEQEI